MNIDNRTLKAMTLLKDTPIQTFLEDYQVSVDKALRIAVNEVELRQFQGKALLLEELLNFIKNGRSTLDNRTTPRPDMGKSF